MAMRALLIAAIAIAAMGAWGCEGSGESTGSDDDLLGELVRFLKSDEFQRSVGTIADFRPRQPTTELLAFAERRYEEDVRIRSAIVEYFLRYESVLLEHGLLTSGDRPNDFIRLLWEEEAKYGFRSPESPGLAGMRRHIREHAGRLGLRQESFDLLRANERLRDIIMCRCYNAGGA